MFARRFSAVAVFVVILLPASAVAGIDDGGGTQAAASGEEDGGSRWLRANPPFTGPARSPDGTFGFQLRLGDDDADAAASAASAAASAASDDGDGDGDGAPMVVATLPRGALLRASEALHTALGREIATRVHEQAQKGALPVMQSGFVLALSDLALTAAVLADVAHNPARERPTTPHPQSYEPPPPSRDTVASLANQCLTVDGARVHHGVRASYVESE